MNILYIMCPLLGKVLVEWGLKNDEIEKIEKIFIDCFHRTKVWFPYGKCGTRI